MPFKRRLAKIKSIQIEGYEIEVSFKPIKNMYLRVSRRTGEIRISAPRRTSEKTIRAFVLSKKKWIEKHQSNLLTEAVLKFEDGELHRYFGLIVPLKVDYVNKNTNAHYHKNGIILTIRSNYDAIRREEVLDRLYRRELKKLVGDLINKWEPVIGVKVREFGIRKMKTRWGTCNIRDQRIWLNLHLAKEKPEIIEMVVVHEMVHLLERLHNKRFYSLMDEFLPDWKERSKELDGRVC